MSKTLRCVMGCNTKINTLIIMEIEAALSDGLANMLMMAYLVGIVVCV